MFADRANIYIRSGKGGDGFVSFRREIFVPAGGPDGGDGGRGGDLILEVEPGLNTLSDFRFIKKYAAEDGERGGKKKCSGRDGQDLVIKVPEGTVVKDVVTGQVITDMSHGNTREVLLKGGRGGKGNQHFATPTMQAPKHSQPGKAAQELNVTLELKVIADVGLVGYPNVGKSTFLSRVTNATPKIANYHFTTLNPNLGVVDLEGGGFVIADIPGLIEGASEGIGLGHEFLRHIERTRVLIHVVDAASTEGRDPIEDIHKINAELHAYNEDLANRPMIIAANKLDTLMEDEADEIVAKIKEEFEPLGIKVFPISGVSGQGVKEVLYYVKKLLDTIEVKPIRFEREYFPENVYMSDEPYTVVMESEGVYVVEGPRIEHMLNYTHLDSEKGFGHFQTFLKKSGILKELEELGIQEGDEVRMYGHAFDYYK